MTDLEIAARLREHGWGVVPPDQHRVDMEPSFLQIWNEVERFTMNDIERGSALFKAGGDICRNLVAGDFVECGVWKGGSCMLMARTLKLLGDTSRILHLFDTFAGMTDPTSEDIIAWNNRSISERWEEDQRADKFISWAITADEVRRNMIATEYDPGQLRFVAGDICETLEEHVPDSVALLRLDTDWYASTAKELEILYPRLVPGGILIVDDYGHFKGARKAVDEYFESIGFFPYLSRPDYTGRVLVKP